MRFVEAVDHLVESYGLSPIEMDLLMSAVKGATRGELDDLLTDARGDIRVRSENLLQAYVNYLISHRLMISFGKYPNEIYQTTESGLEALRGYGCDV
jgi:hypothetical protein